jgi:signal transduction histidine kinase
VDPFVEITSGQNQVPDGSCVLCVHDNGLGIPEADRVTVFERFFRAHAHLDGQLGVTGSGLGLAITADCIQAMGGAIECESTVGVGSRFLITLPLKPPPARNRSALPSEHQDAS